MCSSIPRAGVYWKRITHHVGAHQVYSITTWDLVVTALCHHNNLHTLISVRFKKGFCIDYCHQCRITLSLSLLLPCRVTEILRRPMECLGR
jgi:hypothetical protein